MGSKLSFRAKLAFRMTFLKIDSNKNSLAFWRQEDRSSVNSVLGVQTRIAASPVFSTMRLSVYL